MEYRVSKSIPRYVELLHEKIRYGPPVRLRKIRHQRKKWRYTEAADREYWSKARRTGKIKWKTHTAWRVGYEMTQQMRYIRWKKRNEKCNSG